MTHTPGPWKAFESSERVPFPIGLPAEVGTEAGGGKRTASICEMLWQGDATVANARLIAAAPRMYDYIAQMAETGDPIASSILGEINANS